MTNAKTTGLTLLAIVLALGALALLSMGRHVASGTLFLFTAFTIYVREMSK